MTSFEPSMSMGSRNWNACLAKQNPHRLHCRLKLTSKRNPNPKCKKRNRYPISSENPPIWFVNDGPNTHRWLDPKSPEFDMLWDRMCQRSRIYIVNAYALSCPVSRGESSFRHPKIAAKVKKFVGFVKQNCRPNCIFCSKVITPSHI